MSAPTIDRRGLLAGALAVTATALLPRGGFAQADPLSQEAVLYDPGAPVLGNPEGDVTLVEYFDYQCPYCKEIHPEVMEMVESDGNVRFVMKDWPIFGPTSVRAARLSLGAVAHRPRALAALMRTRGRLSDAEVDAALRSGGFDVAALERGYEANRVRIDGLLARNDAQAEAFGFMGTPSYIAGTVIFPGVPAMADLRTAIDQARSAG